MEMKISIGISSPPRERSERKSKVGFARESQYRFEFMEVDARRLSNYPVPRKKDYVNREGGDRRARACTPGGAQ